MNRNLNTLNQICSKCLVPVVAGALLFGSVTGVGVPFAPSISGMAMAATTTKAPVTYQLVKQGESIITSGARQVDYTWVPSDKTKTTEKVHVVQIDLTNPYVQLNAMSGKAGSVTSRQSVGAMAKETGAVAGINADVFNTDTTASEGAPLGAEIVSGQLVSSTSQLKGIYAFAVTKDKQPIIDQFAFNGAVTADDGTTFALAGVNKSAYVPETGGSAYSHVNALYMYTSNWTAAQRPMNSSTTPTEALVVDGVVTEIADGYEITTPVPANGYVLRGHMTGTSGDFIRTHLQVGQKVTYTYNLTSMTNGQVYDPSSFQMLVSGHTILVDNGAAASFSRDISGVSGAGDRPRTAVGYSKDGKTAYLITVEEKGVPLTELQQIMVQLGVWKGVNMDGGGSTTLVTRQLGDFAVSLAHPTSFGTTQRQVANGIGVYTIAPQGTIQGIAASGPKTLFIGQQATYSLKAYDTYYNPLDPSGLQTQWSADSSIGAFQNGVFTAQKAGTGKLTVASGTAKATLDLEVIGQGQIDKLTAAPNTTLLEAGTTITAPVTAHLKDGRDLAVPASSLTWEFRGFTATVSGGQITITGVNKDVPAYAIARYDGFSTMFALSAGSEKTLEDFENVAYTISFSQLPAETVGTAAVKTGLPGRETSKALDLAYDFTNGTGNRFAYAVLNGDGGLALNGSPTKLTLDVSGDSSNNWLRAEIKDAAGKSYTLTLADKINWSGWKTLSIDLAGVGMTYPAKLTKLYVVNLAQDQDERALTGEVAFDNLTLQYPAQLAPVKSATVLLKVGSKTATVDGKAVKMDTAPIVLNGVTYLPLRFVSDALGGETLWNQQEKRVSVLRGNKMLELWPDRMELIATGIRVPTAAAPILKTGRVLVPIRVISEQLGLKVDWDQQKKTIGIS